MTSLETRPESLPAHPADWQRELGEAIRNGAELVRALGLDAESVCLSGEAAAAFPVVVPRSFLARMRSGDPSDPLLRQVLPVFDETAQHAGFAQDAVGDAAAVRAPGLLQKYAGRALLIATGTCAVHCRYCFRRHFPYDEAPRSLEDWRPALDAIAADPSLHEVLLSGGDPLVLGDRKLAQLVEAIADIDHVRRLRVHTRLPIVLPSRVTDGLLDTLRSSRLTAVVVLHANHARELVGDCAAAVRRLTASGLVTLNQAVLLRGVNDRVDDQRELSERLVELGVVPYYLHQLDRVAGAAHFEVPVAEGVQLMQNLRERVPGYLVPQYVRERPGAASKTPLEPAGPDTDSEANPAAAVDPEAGPAAER